MKNSIINITKNYQEIIDFNKSLRNIVCEDKETEAIIINFDKGVKKNKLEYYTVGLSLSDDNMHWKLYRIYQSNTIAR